jgi:hypothetical protein
MTRIFMATGGKFLRQSWSLNAVGRNFARVDDKLDEGTHHVRRLYQVELLMNAALRCVLPSDASESAMLRRRLLSGIKPRCYLHVVTRFFFIPELRETSAAPYDSSALSGLIIER